MTIEDVDHFQRKVADVGCEFGLLQASELGVNSRSSFAVGAVGRAASG